ncbi:helix-turn-helix domain-containing protein [Actinoallomurus purpureus]|uniref:helix-turn-helix domain-containing protein n=1 Tax=Actinoallomurus purpureus TaxID=478114 RepID=UPI00209376F5|nr:helix-turn-helix transcriptional regulator [Actinoallomurus purpureus]MCO6011086.1 helix-turn-helix domain-containing protein [Actinoallomurus purpureus]
MPDPSPTIRERRIAIELRRLREQTGLTLDQAAERLGWSRATLGRMETAIRRIKPVELQRLLDIYKVDVRRRDDLAELARGARERGWWHRYTDTLPAAYASYIALEADARSLRCYDALVVHGLLQTEDYAREVIKAGLMQLASDSEVERRVEVRLNRQALLAERTPPLELWCVIDENTLRRMIGGTAVMRAQYTHLAELAELPNVTLQVLPHKVGAHPGVEGTFAILEFPERYMPDVGYIEALNGALYLEDDTDVHAYSLVFNRLVAEALGLGESAAFLRRLAAEET